MPRRPLTYLDGVGAGISAVAIAAALWLGVRSADMAALYASFGDARLGALTRLALHPALRLIVPASLLAALVLLHARRPHRYAMPALAAIGAALVLLWCWALWAPIHELTDAIR